MTKKKKTTSKTSKLSSPKSSQGVKRGGSGLPKINMSVVLAICTIVSFVLSFVVFWPRISVETGEALDPRNPFSIPFIVKNDGYLLCYSVHHSLNIKNIELKNQIIFKGGGVEGLDEDIPKLCPNNSSAISIQRMFGMPSDFVEKAEIYIDLSYKTRWIPHTFKDSYRFKMARKSNGDYVWQKKYDDK